MYLKNIAIKNVGPIEELNLEMTFDGDGKPKPVIFVGENGTGKTILLSQIVDAFYEISGGLFQDVRISAGGLGYKYYKLSGQKNLKSGSSKGFSALQFYNKDNEKVEYYDKMDSTENVLQEDILKLINDFSLVIDEVKKVTPDLVQGENKTKMQEELRKQVHFYQPAYRREEPFWRAYDSTIKSEFSYRENINNELGKEFEIISSHKPNRDFLLDTILDKGVIENISYQNKLTEIANKWKLGEKYSNETIHIPDTFDSLAWKSANSLLKKIKGEGCYFIVGSRLADRVRISMQSSNKSDASSFGVENLSLGESILLNLFINILRHAYHPNIKSLNEIQGIVVIDEIDTHLHTQTYNMMSYQSLSQCFQKFSSLSHHTRHFLF